MYRLDLYLIRQIATACLFIALAVVLVMLFAVSFRLLSLVIDSAATATIFLHLMALTAPTFLPLVLPIALPVAVVFIYNKLSIDSEIVVMRTAGLSPLRLAWPVFFCGGVLAILGMIITMQIAPWANRELVKLQYEVRNNYSSLLIRPNTFNDIAAGLTFFTRGRDREGGLEGILIHDTRKPDVTVTVMADRGTIVSSPDGEPKIVVFNGVRQEYDRTQNRLNQLDFENYTFDLSLLAGNVSSRTPDARELGVAALLERYQDLQHTTLEQRTALMSELHQRLATPLMTLSFSILCAAMMLGGEFNRRGMTRRVIAAAAIIILLESIMLWLGNLMNKDLALAPAFYGLAIIGLPLGIWLLLRDPFRSTPSTQTVMVQP